ncbi:hypothetical protein Efla_005503 [Eimeria flavescens]
MALSSQQTSLLKLLEESQCECRNEAKANSLLPLLKRTAAAEEEKQTDTEPPLLASADEDPQLFISLGFSVPVRLTGLRLAAPRGSLESGKGPPKRIRLFQNDPTKSFADAETDAATDEFELPEDESIESGISLPLRSVRYKNVASLQIFIAENGGADATKISALDVYGSPTDSLQMKDWKPLKPEEALAVYVHLKESFLLLLSSWRKTKTIEQNTGAPTSPLPLPSDTAAAAGEGGRGTASCFYSSSKGDRKNRRHLPLQLPPLQQVTSAAAAAGDMHRSIFSVVFLQTVATDGEQGPPATKKEASLSVPLLLLQQRMHACSTQHACMHGFLIPSWPPNRKLHIWREVSS